MSAQPMTDEEIADLKRKEAARTQGEWLYRQHPPTVITATGFFTIAPIQSWDRQQENATYIAAACNAVPRLLAERDADKAEIARLRESLRAMDRWVSP